PRRKDDVPARLAQTRRVGMSDLRMGTYPLFELLGCSPRVEVYRGGRRGIEGFEKAVVVWRVAPTWVAARHVIEEARRCGFLTHSNVAQVLDAGVCADEGYVVTEYVQGVSMARARATTEIAWPVVVYAVAQVADALAYAHARRDREGNLLRIVHGGISPHRILLGVSGGVKLTGFAIPWSREFAEDTHEASFRSPEQRQRAPIDGRSDVYSLGMTLHACLPETAPSSVEDIVSFACARLPEERPHAGQLRDTLRAVLAHESPHIGPRDIAALLDRLGPSSEEREIPGRPPPVRLPAADLETALAEMDPFCDVDAALALYEELGRRFVEEGAGARGLRPIITGLDLADGLGRDRQAARLCMLLSQLCAQASRLDESLEWRARATTLSQAPFAKTG
ncbi:MAG: protein kinase, partial [Polyangiales bacterium]